MTKEYSRENFSQFSKDQLLDYIEQQNEQLSRFEGRFRDVVRAYKGLLKEKEALESSLRALSTRTSTPSRDRSHDPIATSLNVTISEQENCTSDGETIDSQQSTTEEGGGIDLDVGALQDQVSTLTQALSTVMEEKSKMEMSFQQDKKNLLTQQETLNITLSTLREDLSNLQQEIEDLREKLTQEKRGRKEEEDNHGEMIQELQKIVNNERNENEDLTNQLQILTVELTNVRQQVAENRTQEYEDKLQLLTNDLEKVRSELKMAEERLSMPSPLVAKLQEDMRNIAMEHSRSLEVEQRKVLEAERRLQEEEERISGLESKLSELSEIVGSCNKQKEQDQCSIQKLKDRIANLDSENTALTKAHLEMTTQISDETVEQISLLQEKVSKLRQLIRVATQKILERSNVPGNIEDMSVTEYSDMLASEPSRKKYQEELTQLQYEFDTYKQRAQSVLRNKNSKEHETDRERHEFEQRYEETIKMVETLRREKEEEKERFSLELQRLRVEMREMGNKHRHELMQAEIEHKQKLQDLQFHIQTTRERTQKLLEDKNNEISSLRGEIQARRGKLSYSSGHSDSLEHSLTSTALDGNIQDGFSYRQEPAGYAIQELLDQPSPTSSDVKWFLHNQEQQRINGEFTSLRRKRLELEDNVRDLLEREQRHIEQTSALKDEIRKLERDRSRETENFEYLKNVILHFMISDSTSREQLIKPIATVLHFTPNEIHAVERRVAGRGWFSPSK